MTQLQMLKNNMDIAVYGITREEAMKLGICISCRKYPTFKTIEGVKEYQITALCEPCFDEITKEPEE